MTDAAPDHIKNREEIVLKRLKEEIIGPSPRGEPIDCTAAEIQFADKDDAYAPHRQEGSGEEILRWYRPCKRYGVGVLYPAEIDYEELAIDDAPDDEELEAVDIIEQSAKEDMDSINENVAKTNRVANEFDALDSEGDFELAGANAYRPSAMAVSFLSEVGKDSRLIVSVTGGRYRKKKGLKRSSAPESGDAADAVGNEEAEADEGTEPLDSAPSGRGMDLWLRSAVKLQVVFKGDSLLENGIFKTGEILESENLEELDLEVQVRARAGDGGRLLTVCLLNKAKKSEGPPDELCLFQTGFTVQFEADDGVSKIIPYPEPTFKGLDEEEESFQLLYREKPTFAVGHGCAGDWENEGDLYVATKVIGRSLPTYETPSFTPDITGEDGKALKVPMEALAGLKDGDDGFDSLENVVEGYSSWIDDRLAEVAELPERYREAARRNLSSCGACRDRMRSGLEYLKSNPQASEAFKLANHAILLQQLQTAGRESRPVKFDKKRSRFSFDTAFKPDVTNIPEGRGSWRAFQIGFLLMSIESSGEGMAEDRERVELIWFPTGGGKTEAYLGLAAYTLFLRRLKDPTDAGVHVLMRYTLRLLTAQQFQRTSALLCAMEYLRRRNESLGDGEFSIGIWVGRKNTPNRRRDALTALRALAGRRKEPNMFLVSRCPWCRAQIGPLDPSETRKGAPRVAGYKEEDRTVIFHCTDSECEFHAKLPIYVIDEDLYEKRPSLVIGTVDKFVQLTWNPKARSLFGIGDSGERELSPPGLIIQDELHLISGPLGSMCGLYEAVIEELCTDRRCETPVCPKIVSSTATIRRYEDQIRGLFAREKVTLFPPPGLDAGDSFFASYAKNDDGELEKGRMYVGVHGGGLGSMETAQVRVFSSLFQAPFELDSAERDPWWTMLIFFNSLWGIQKATSLFQSDVRDYLKLIRKRSGLDWDDLRKLRNVKELTSRISDDEVPVRLTELETPFEGEGSFPVDVCLASNIIEVGVDIDRLSLMCVVGQPKTTAQYIQVTGRVGRKPKTRPGLVATIYSASASRDRSHFEKFRAYHGRLDAQVEPTSVTSFSLPALERALHAVMVAYVRQRGAIGGVARYPDESKNGLLDELRSILKKRIQFVDPAAMKDFDEVFSRYEKEWAERETDRYSLYDDMDRENERAPLLVAAGQHVRREWESRTWPTPQSMRNVDAECLLLLANAYRGGG